MVDGIAAIMPGPNQPFLIDVITVDAPGPGEILIVESGRCLPH